MALLRTRKVASLPVSLVASALYFVRRGSFFDLLVSDNEGAVAVPISVTQAARHGMSPQMADQSIANTLTKILGSVLSFKDGEIKPGMVVRWHVRGTTTGGNAASTLSLRAGANNTVADGAIASFAIPAAASGENNPFSLTVEATVRSVGASANVRASGRLAKNGVGGIGGGTASVLLGGNINPASFELAAATLTNFNSTGNKFLHLCFQSANANTSITVTQCWAEIVYPGA